MGWAGGDPPGGRYGAVKFATEIKKGDQFIGDDNRLYWTAESDAGDPSGGEVHVRVRDPKGRVFHRWLPVGVPLPVYGPGTWPVAHPG